MVLCLIFVGAKEVEKVEDKLLRKPTVRHACYAVLLRQSAAMTRCSSCKSHRHTLRSLACRIDKLECSLSAVDRSAPDSHVNYRFLRTPEKIDRLKRIHSELRCTQLEKECDLAKAIEAEGIVVDTDTDADLHEIMTNNDAQIVKTYPEDSFQQVFWKQQR